MKAADKSHASYALVLGDDEVISGKCELKLMSSGEAISSNLTVSEIINRLGMKK